MSVSTTTKVTETVFSATITMPKKEFHLMKRWLDEYNRCWPGAMDRMISAESKLEQAETEISSLKETIEVLNKELLTWQIPCPADGLLSIADCGGFDCSECQILIDTMKE